MGKKQIGTYCVIGLIAAAVCLFLKNADRIASVFSLAFSAAAPLLVGCVIAYVLNILLKRIERFWFPGTKRRFLIKLRRPVCILLSFLALVLIMAGVVYLVVPELVSSIRLVTDEIPPVIEEIRLWAIAHLEEMPEIQTYLENADIDWKNMMEKAVNILLTGAGGIFNSVVLVFSKVIGTAARFMIGSIFAVYLLSSKEKLASQGDRIMRAYLPDRVRNTVCYALKTLHEVFTSFIVGQCMEAVIIGTLCALGMTLLRFPYAVMTGAVVGVTALIPVVGAYIGAAVGAFMVFTVNPIQAVGFIIFLVLLQQLEGNLIYPRVVGSSIGLPGMWVLAAVTIGGGVLGVGGMLLGVPLAAAAYRFLGDGRTGREEKGRPDRSGSRHWDRRPGGGRGRILLPGNGKV